MCILHGHDLISRYHMTPYMMNYKCCKLKFWLPTWLQLHMMQIWHTIWQIIWGMIWRLPAIYMCASNCVNKLVVVYFLLASSSSRGNGDNNANKEDGGQGRGVQGAGSREQEAETGSEAYFPLKMPQYVDFKQRQRQRQRAERTSTRQPDRQQQFNIHIYFYSHFISLGSRYCWLYYFYCCCSCSYYCCLSWQLCQRSHVNICTPFLEQVKLKHPLMERHQSQNIRRTFVLMLPGDIKRRFQGLRLVKRRWLFSELQIRWELKFLSWVSYSFWLYWNRNFIFFNETLFCSLSFSWSQLT